MFFSHWHPWGGLIVPMSLSKLCCFIVAAWSFSSCLVAAVVVAGESWLQISRLELMTNEDKLEGTLTKETMLNSFLNFQVDNGNLVRKSTDTCIQKGCKLQSWSNQKLSLMLSRIRLVLTNCTPLSACMWQNVINKNHVFCFFHFSFKSFRTRTMHCSNCILNQTQKMCSISIWSKLDRNHWESDCFEIPLVCLHQASCKSFFTHQKIVCLLQCDKNSSNEFWDCLHSALLLIFSRKKSLVPFCYAFLCKLKEIIEKKHLVIDILPILVWFSLMNDHNWPLCTVSVMIFTTSC